MPNPKNERPTSARIQRAHVHRGVDDQQRGHGGQDVPEDDAPAGHAHEPRGLDELAFLERQRHAAHDSRGDHPLERGEQQDEETATCGPETTATEWR